MNYKHSDEVVLSKVATYVNEKMDSSLLNNSNYVSTENMLPNKGGLVRAETIPTGKVNRFLKNDILISNIRPYFKKIWYADKNGGCSADVLTVRSNSEVYSRYLYYVLMDDFFFEYSMKGSKGTKMPRGDKGHIMNYPIRVPSYKTQQAIANILSSLDDKIELNNKINKNLEELAQTLYKQWFVDFEFPNKDGEPYKSSGGEMVESELGLIPKEWYVDLLGNVVNIIYGKNLPTKNLLLKGYPVFGGNGIIGYNDKFLYKNPKVLVSCRGAASGSVLNSLKNSFVTNNSLILEDNEKISYEYLKELSKNRSYFDFVSGSAQPQVTIASISQCKIIIPQRKTLNEFTKVMKECNEIIENLYYENLKLAQLRDELLPKLMSGEIVVPIEE
ncbi:MAG: restriction endonuclease subunit S [Acholeplasma sp.]|nr:restriction endonuclease subunit S [Acholeplasma sp.]